MRASLVAVVIAAACCHPTDEYTHGGDEVEANLLLERIGMDAKAHYAELGMFPVGKAGPTPATRCCTQPDGRCPANPQLWLSDPVWRKLEMTLEKSHRFQYTFESDGKSAVATAIGDFDCDGDTVTYKLTLTPAASGLPTMELVAPPRDSD